MKQFKPTAHISVGKNRTKKGREVYLNDGTEFEIELHNPTEFVVCAKIWINGIQMEGGALVVKPAQRVHLDRYLNEPKKLKFSTYNVSGTKAEIENAIKKNGLIEVKFYNEIKPIQGNPITIQGGNGLCNPWQPSPNDFWYTGTPNWKGYDIICDNLNNGTLNLDSSSGSTNAFFDAGSTFTSSDEHLGDVTCNFVHTSGVMDNNDFKDMINEYLNEEEPQTRSAEPKKSKKKETGRIEAGSQSQQTFEYVNMSFAYSPCAEYEYHILPASEKPVTANEIGGKIYCTGCKLRKRKPTWQFCPKCGTEFEF